MLPEKGVLGKDQIANLGKNKTVTSQRFPTAGAHIHVEDFPITPSIYAAPVNQYDAENISIVIDATLVPNAIDGNVNTVMLQGVISWQIGTSLFGDKRERNFGGGLITTEEVVFDIHSGVAFTLPAVAGLSLKLRVTSISNAGFAGGGVLKAFPSVIINGGYSYGTIDPFTFTVTQYVIKGNDITNATPFSLVAGGGAGSFGSIVKPKFAQSSQVVWQNYIAATPVEITFDGLIVGGGWGPISLVGGTVPPPLLPWPVDSWFATITNRDAGADTADFVKVISNLSL
jgi:hypothetical protein